MAQFEHEAALRKESTNTPPYVEEKEHITGPSTPPGATTDAEKRLLRKIDIHLIPILFLIYMLSFLDRINIGNAKIQGLTQELHMSGTDYNATLLVFFVPYILLEVPSNIVLKKFEPSWWLSGLMFFWGSDPFLSQVRFVLICHRYMYGVHGIVSQLCRSTGLSRLPCCLRSWRLPWMRIPDILQAL
jgi:hypothetical protein